MKELLSMLIAVAATANKAFAINMIYSDFIQERFNLIELNIFEVMMLTSFISIFCHVAHKSTPALTTDDVIKHTLGGALVVWVSTGFIYLYSLFA
ncbi:hypothetical protein JLT2_41 [Paraglaciecola Antarctic JLT virus 2]|nr:hypothetical protein JLT2_41 [Paraglaciecola Antarctic JLT virus 2]